MKTLDKKVSKLNVSDVGLVKLATIAFTLFIITIWPAAMDWVHSVNPWYFLIALIILGIRPFYRFYIK